MRKQALQLLSGTQQRTECLSSRSLADWGDVHCGESTVFMVNNYLMQQNHTKVHRGTQSAANR
ncbi:hypothetical protein FD723_41130 (plasmid) [Nostoc sp. C052]|uniref:hypothetical protein n=1 Tax=Nostoc sp. C052 TaxID=2576902 RepID=UPI0015C2E76A|nr:hypothetical protein [Nostoc sp. C052]QLE46613.1 hypothetical protein FD723_41130 [Nostoc sp. C052]